MISKSQVAELREAHAKYGNGGCVSYNELFDTIDALYVENERLQRFANSYERDSARANDMCIKLRRVAEAAKEYVAKQHYGTYDEVNLKWDDMKEALAALESSQRSEGEKK